jgi:hypothetical protein
LHEEHSGMNPLAKAVSQKNKVKLTSFWESI